MGLQPKIQRTNKGFLLKSCQRCGSSFSEEGFAPTKSLFYPDGVIPVCNDCVDRLVETRTEGGDWKMVDKLCQLADIPFVPKQWVTIYDMNPVGAFYRYATIFQGAEYEGLGWGDYFDAFRTLREQQKIEEELPGLAEEKQKKLRERWGGNYDDQALAYLDDLYNGLLNTQNINGKLQKDQAEKICKISYEIDCRIRDGTDFDKLLASYDKLVKAADFTPKNVKNINDFDTCGELIKWLEKTGWINQYYDNVPRDIVDETIANIQAFNQRLYTNESGIGEEITRRLENLKTAQQLETGNYYSTGSEVEDIDAYENDGYEKLFKYDDEFKAEEDDE